MKKQQKNEVLIRQMCAGGRIPDAVKIATIWLIPKDAEKPADRRFKNTKK
jgi:hypothetical protein